MHAWFQKAVARYITIIIRFSWLIVIAAALAAAFAIAPTKQLFSNIRTDFKTLLPEDYESVQRLEEVENLFGQLKDLTLVIETKNPQALKRAIPELARFLEEEPEVKDVEWRKRGYDFFDRHKLFYPSIESLEELRHRIDRRIQREKLGRFFVSLDEDEEEGMQEDSIEELRKRFEDIYSAGNILSEFYTDKEETVFFMIVHLAGETFDIGYFKRFTDQIFARLKAFDLASRDPTANVHATGIINAAFEYDSLLTDLKLAGGISLSIILFLIIGYFRSFRAIIFVTTPLLVGLVWNFAIIWHLVGHLNIITSFLFSILFGLGIEIGIHLNSRYTEERKRGNGLETALAQTLLHSGRSCLTAAITLACAFSILIFNDFKGFSEFGTIAAIGILINYIANILLVPAMLAIEEQLPLFRRKKFPLPGWKLATIIAFPHRTMTAIFCLITAAALLISAFGLSFDYNFANFTATSPERKRAQELYERVNPRRASPSVVLVASAEDAHAVTQAIQERRDRNPDTLMQTAKNIHDIVPADQREKIPLLRQIKKLLDDDVVDAFTEEENKGELQRLRASAAADPFTLEELPQIIRDSFVSPETRRHELVYIAVKPEVDLKDGRKAMALADEIRNIELSDGRVLHATSSTIIFADVLSVMLKDSPFAIISAFLTIFFLLLLDFRSLRAAALTMVPIISGILWMLGIMVLIGEHLNFYNMIVLPVILGISIDNSVHLFHRIREEGLGDLKKIITTTGGSIAMASFTNAAGFAGMIFAHHGGLHSIGIIAVLGMFCCLATSLVFFPHLVTLVLRTRWGQTPRGPVPGGRVPLGNRPH